MYGVSRWDNTTPYNFSRYLPTDIIFALLLFHPPIIWFTLFIRHKPAITMGPKDGLQHPLITHKTFLKNTIPLVCCYPLAFHKAIENLSLVSDALSKTRTVWNCHWPTWVARCAGDRGSGRLRNLKCSRTPNCQWISTDRCSKRCVNQMRK